MSKQTDFDMVPEETELAVTQKVDVAKPRPNLLSLALSNNAAIDVIERLAALQEKEMARDAEQSFDSSLRSAQEEIKPVKPNKQVKTSAGKLMYAYASYEALDEVVRPIYLRHGFSLSFTGGEAPNGRVRVFCRCSHRDGHSQVYQMDLPVDPGRAGLTQTDAELGANSKAKRRLLRNIFNIVDDDEDESLTNGWLNERCEWIANAKDLDELDKLYKQAALIALEQADKIAMAHLIKSRDERKKELE